MLPQVVEKTTHSLFHSLGTRLSKLDTVYLYGSVALGDFIEGSSDIDFVAIVREPLTPAEIQTILTAHKEIEKQFPATDIMGAYLLKSDLGKPQNEISSPVTYYNKQVHTNGFGSDLNPVTWWILNKYGIQVYGSTQSIDYELELKSLLNYVIENMNTYWANSIQRLEEQLAFIHLADQQNATKQLDEAVEWCTLGMLRQLYTIKERDTKSKVAAGYYGLTTIPQQWHNLIHEAINIKRLLPERYYTSNEQRLHELLPLLRYIHQEANLAYDKLALHT